MDFRQTTFPSATCAQIERALSAHRVDEFAIHSGSGAGAIPQPFGYFSPALAAQSSSPLAAFTAMSCSFPSRRPMVKSLPPTIE
jgi:hypothetical protein